MSRHHHAQGIDGRTGQQLVGATLQLYGTTCHLCGGEGADSSDHLVPIGLGGHPRELANRRPAHLDCNRRRGAMPLTDWFARNPLPTRPTAAPSRQW